MADKPPFTFTGVECFGPTYVKQGRARVKRYGSLYTYLKTCAIHLKVQHQMDTDSVINSFRCLVCLKGNPERVCSDQGTNFLGGHAEFKNSIKQFDKAKIVTSLSSECIDRCSSLLQLLTWVGAGRSQLVFVSWSSWVFLTLVVP